MNYFVIQQMIHQYSLPGGHVARQPFTILIPSIILFVY
jgi:hypothetical protein